MRDSDGPEHVNAETQHRLVRGEVSRADTRFGGARTVDEHVEPPVLVLNLVGRCSDACIACWVDLEEDAPEFVGGPLPAFGIARPDEHGVSDFKQSACRLAPKSLVRAGDQGNGHGPKYHRPLG